MIVTSVAPVMHGVARPPARSIRPTRPSGIEEPAHARTYLEERGVEADYVPAVRDAARTIAMLAEERDADPIVLERASPGWSTACSARASASRSRAGRTAT